MTTTTTFVEWDGPDRVRLAVIEEEQVTPWMTRTSRATIRLDRLTAVRLAALLLDKPSP